MVDVNLAQAVDTPVDDVLQAIRSIFAKKNQDYSSGGPWSNFELAGAQLQADRATACELHIATKQARLRALGYGHAGIDRQPANESVRDTLLDRATYAVIALAMYDETVSTEATTVQKVVNRLHQEHG